MTFTGPNPHILRFANACEDSVKAAGDSRDCRKGGRIHGIHAYGNAVESRILQRLRQVVKEVPICGSVLYQEIARHLPLRLPEFRRADRQCALQRVSRTISKRPERRRGSPPVRRTFSTPRDDKELDHSEVIVDWKFGILRAFIPRSAIDAFIVAAIRDRDTKIGNARPNLSRSLS